MKETVRHIALIPQQRGEDVATTNVWYFEATDAPRVDFALTVTPEGRVLHLSDAALKSESIYSRLPSTSASRGCGCLQGTPARQRH